MTDISPLTDQSRRLGPFEALHEAMWLHLRGRLESAEDIFRQIRAEPAASIARRQLIALLRQQHRWEDALEVVREHAAAHPKNPEIAYYLATSLLGLGRYPEGFSFYEARRFTPRFAASPRTSAPEWKGEPVNRLLLVEEQGFGDSIMFVRYVAELARRGISISLLCRPQVRPLFEASLAGLASVCAEPPADVEAWAFLGSLPLRLQVTPETAPIAAYLKAPEDRQTEWRQRLPAAARVGVATQGNPSHPNHANRSLPPEVAAFAQSFRGAVSLDFATNALGLRDFADTAAVIERLDLVISVDTAVAHLAGALGKPCWLLLPHQPDWRWLHDRTDSPWYPSLRLYRQPNPGDWVSVLTAVRRDFQAAFPPEAPRP